ncbi:MAG: acyltransferase [Anaerolineales bacterium]|nr:acyltransferase [Anaerolineales bacterium]
MIRPHYRPDIEGLRAIAILLALGYHADVPGFSGGYVGVDIFFVLSGYLITWLLVHEAQETGAISLGRFYARRARRLLPAMVVMLLATVMVGAVIYAPFEQRDLASTAIATATYWSNIHFANLATDYLSPASETNPFLHTWSLSVEEQFYLLWPLFVMLLLGVARWQGRAVNHRRLWWGAILLTGLSFALSVYLTSTRQPMAFFLLPARAWEFAAGALAVLLPPPEKLKSFMPKFLNVDLPGGATPLLGWVGLGGLVAANLFFDRSTAFPGVAALLPVLATVLLLRAGAGPAETGITKLLSLRPLQEIGRLSYSWYLWHWPVLVFATANYRLPLGVRLALLAVSLLLAAASYHFVESPIRYHRVLVRRSGYSLAMAACITILGLGLTYGWRQLSVSWAKLPEQARFTQVIDELPEIYNTGCHADFFEVGLKVENCTAGPADASRRLVLFGDSHAAQWYPALEQLATEQGWRLISLTKSACPAVDLLKFHPRMGRDYVECSEWRQAALQVMKELKPDLVVVSSSASQIQRSEWQPGMERILDSLSETSRSVVLLRDTPYPGFDVPRCLARHQWGAAITPVPACEIVAQNKASIELYNLQLEAAAHYPNVFVVDMEPYICPEMPCQLERDELILYRDSHHLSVPFVKSLTETLAMQLSRAGAPQGTVSTD